MNQRSLLLIDDEPEILELLTFTFQREGYQLRTAGSAELGWGLLKEKRPDLIILDLMLPGMDGLSFCRRLQSDPQFKQIPIVMLTARADDVDVVSGLELGASDYVTKPFSPRILAARVRGLLRNANEPDFEAPKTDGEAALIEVGDIVIDQARHRVSCGGLNVELSATEFALLAFLAKSPGWVFSRQKIIDNVQGKDYPVTERSVDVQILGLRKKLGRYGGKVETVRGVGYRFAATEET